MTRFAFPAWAAALAFRSMGPQQRYLTKALALGGTWVSRTGLGRNKSVTALWWLVENLQGEAR